MAKKPTKRKPTKRKTPKAPVQAVEAPTARKMVLGDIVAPPKPPKRPTPPRRAAPDPVETYDLLLERMAESWGDKASALTPLAEAFLHKFLVPHVAVVPFEASPEQKKAAENALRAAVDDGGLLPAEMYAVMVKAGRIK